MTRKAIVVDFDDTLFFTQKSKEAASMEILGKKLSKEQIRKLRPIKLKSRVYDLSQSKYLDLSIPNRKLVRVLYKEKDSNAKIFILTARSTRSRKPTLELLKRYKVPFHKAIFREHRLLHTEDEAWKLSKIKEFAHRYDSIVFYEDKPDNIAYFKKGLNVPGKHRFVLVEEDGNHKEVL